MKKVLALLLPVFLIFSLSACGQNKEKMLNDAIELNWKEVYNEYLSNEARAINNYDNKIVKWTAVVYDIDKKSVEMASETYNGLPSNSITVYLSKDEIINLEEYQVITIVGELHLGSFTSISNAFIVE